MMFAFHRVLPVASIHFAMSGLCCREVGYGSVNAPVKMLEMWVASDPLTLTSSDPVGLGFSLESGGFICRRATREGESNEKPPHLASVEWRVELPRGKAFAKSKYVIGFAECRFSLI